MSIDAPSHLQALTLAQVAELLAISEDTARRLCESGRLRSIEVGIGGRRMARRVLVRDLEAYIDAQSNSDPEPEQPPRPKRRQQRDRDFVEYYK